MTKGRRGQAVQQTAGAPRSRRPTLPRDNSPIVAPTDPGLEAFVRELGYLAADAALRNYQEHGGFGPVSIISPRGFDRTPPARRQRRKA